MDIDVYGDRGYGGVGNPGDTGPGPIEVKPPSPPPAISVTATGPSVLQVGQVLNNASVQFHLSDAEYEEQIAGAHFTVQGLPAGLRLGNVSRVGSKTVKVAITGTPSAEKTTETRLDYSITVGAVNLMDIDIDISPSGIIKTSKIAARKDGDSGGNNTEENGGNNGTDGSGGGGGNNTGDTGGNNGGNNGTGGTGGNGGDGSNNGKNGTGGDSDASFWGKLGAAFKSAFGGVGDFFGYIGSKLGSFFGFVGEKITVGFKNLATWMAAHPLGAVLGLGVLAGAVALFHWLLIPFIFAQRTKGQKEKELSKIMRARMGQ